MNNGLTGDDIVKIITAIFAGLGTLGTVVIGILQLRLGSKVERNDMIATVARGDLANKIDHQAGTITLLEKNTNSIKDALVASTDRAARAEGKAEGKAESVPVPTGAVIPAGQTPVEIKGTLEVKKS